MAKSFMPIFKLLTMLMGVINPPPMQREAQLVFNTTLPKHQFVVDGDSFYRNVLKFDTAQMEEFKRECLHYFESVFGFSNPMANPNLYMMLFQVNPAADLRCVKLSGDTPPPAGGYKTISAGWMVTVVNPNGLTLRGGQFNGTHVQHGTTFSKGHWLIERSNHAAGEHDLLWEIQDSRPGSVAQYQVNMVTNGTINVTSPDWGQGLSIHRSVYTFMGSGLAHAVFQNNITFGNP